MPRNIPGDAAACRLAELAYTAALAEYDSALAERDAAARIVYGSRGCDAAACDRLAVATVALRDADSYRRRARGQWINAAVA